MKKILLCMGLLLLFTGCSKVSQKDYDELKSEYDTLKTDYDNIQNENSRLKNDYNTLKEENDTTKADYKEYLNKYSEVIANNSDKNFIEAWGKTAFGDGVECGKIDNDKVQLTVSMTNVNSKNINKFMTTLYDNISLLGVLYGATSNMEVHKIYLKVIDNDSSPVFEIFLNLEDTTDLKVEFSVSETYSSIVYSTLNESQ